MKSAFTCVLINSIGVIGVNKRGMLGAQIFLSKKVREKNELINLTYFSLYVSFSVPTPLCLAIATK